MPNEAVKMTWFGKTKAQDALQPHDYPYKGHDTYHEDISPRTCKIQGPSSPPNTLWDEQTRVIPAEIQYTPYPIIRSFPKIVQLTHLNAVS